MKISLLTDAPKHNLALMKISNWYKYSGHEIIFNMPLWKGDYTYASILFEWNKNKFKADEYGGPAFKNGDYLGSAIDSMVPDYGLYGIDYSLGYTFRPCFRKCGFCKVHKFKHPDRTHHSIFEFHDTNFNKICLLNNNTFLDPNWKETFQEIWDANLTVIDENGYDIRLLDDEKAHALKKTKFYNGLFGFAWDCIGDEPQIINGLEIAKKHKLLTHNTNFFILIGYDTTEEEDIYRCQKIVDYGAHPYPMPFVRNNYTKRFKRFMNLHYYRSYPTIEKAWMDYKR